MVKYTNEIPEEKEIVVYEKSENGEIKLFGSEDNYSIKKEYTFLIENGKKEELEFVLEANGRIPDGYLLKALELAGGNITRASRLINVDRSIYYHRCTQIDGFREKIAEIRERKLDFAEDQLWEHVEMNNLPAVMFYLRTLGKERGYTTQVELVGNKDKPVEISINLGSHSNNVDEFEEYG